MGNQQTTQVADGSDTQIVIETDDGDDQRVAVPVMGPGPLRGLERGASIQKLLPTRIAEDRISSPKSMKISSPRNAVTPLDPPKDPISPSSLPKEAVENPEAFEARRRSNTLSGQQRKTASNTGAPGSSQTKLPAQRRRAGTVRQRRRLSFVFDFEQDLRAAPERRVRPKRRPRQFTVEMLSETVYDTVENFPRDLADLIASFAALDGFWFVTSDSRLAFIYFYDDNKFRGFVADVKRTIPPKARDVKTISHYLAYTVLNDDFSKESDSRPQDAFMGTTSDDFTALNGDFVLIKGKDARLSGLGRLSFSLNQGRQSVAAKIQSWNTGYWYGYGGYMRVLLQLEEYLWATRLVVASLDAFSCGDADE